MRVLLMGRKRSCAGLLEFLVERGHQVVAVLTDNHIQGSPTHEKALELGVRVASQDEIVAEIRSGDIEYDLGLSMVYWRKIPSVLFEAAPLGIVNFHPAPLPDYKGTAGYNIAILEGLDSWAVSAHYVDEGIDTGDIIEVDRFAIDPSAETAVSLERKSMTRLVEQARRIVVRLETSARLETFPNEGGRYISRQEMEQMKQIRPGDDVERKVRAFWFPPYRGATIELDGHQYTLVNDDILSSLSVGESTSLYSKPRV